jgi:ectoine hydroxylase-related dioxygenase (phytanoyl-CoA dioxygenase family)
MLKELKDLKMQIYPLTIDQDQQAFFKEQGYLHLKSFYSKELISEIVEEIWRNLPEEKGQPDTWNRSEQKVTVLENFCQSELEWQLFSHPKLIKIAENLLHVNLDHLYWGKTGTLVINWPTSSDWTTLHLESTFEHGDFDDGANLFYVLIYLNPRHQLSATTKLVPGSHLLVKDYLKRKKKHLSIQDIDDLNLDQPITIKADQGDLLIFDATLVHSGGGQRHNTPRFLLRTSFHNGLSSLKNIRTKVPQHLRKIMSKNEKQLFE